MKRTGSAVALVFALLAFESHAEVYRWIDANGIAHYTSDINQVPASQRDLARKTVPTGKGSLQRIESAAAPRVVGSSPPSARAPSVPAARAAEDVVEGKTEAQWRAEVERLRSRVSLYSGPAERCERDEFRWTRSAGGDKYREEQAEAEACRQTASDYALAQKMLADFVERAHRAGVPPGWIRE